MITVKYKIPIQAYNEYRHIKMAWTYRIFYINDFNEFKLAFSEFPLDDYLGVNITNKTWIFGISKEEIYLKYEFYIEENIYQECVNYLSNIIPANKIYKS